MATVWRAGDVLPRERAVSFIDAASRMIAPYERPADIVVEEHNELSVTDVGPLQIMGVNWTRGEATRTTRMVRRSDPELCKIDIAISGGFLVEQYDRQAALSAGAFTFVDLSRPHRVAARRTDLAVVMFPRALLPLRDSDIKELAAATFDATHPGGALVASVVRALIADLDAYRGPAGAGFATCVVDLVSATLAARVGRWRAVPGEARQRLLVNRICGFIEDNLGDPRLTPRGIAAAHHISVRHLHKLFDQEGTTVAGLIRGRRLERCRHDLLDPARAATTVGAIAWRWGFRDAGYFSRIFHAEFGVPPGQYRRLAQPARPTLPARPAQPTESRWDTGTSAGARNAP